MNSQLYIPKKIKVGFQTRTDTYTGKLAYVVYYDDKGVLRKEKSWTSWRDSKIDPQDIDKTPIIAFNIEKKGKVFLFNPTRLSPLHEYDTRVWRVETNRLLFSEHIMGQIKSFFRNHT